MDADTIDTLIKSFYKGDISIFPSDYNEPINLSDIIPAVRAMASNHRPDVVVSNDHSIYVLYRGHAQCDECDSVFSLTDSPKIILEKWAVTPNYNFSNPTLAHIWTKEIASSKYLYPTSVASTDDNGVLVMVQNDTLREGNDTVNLANGETHSNSHSKNVSGNSLQTYFLKVSNEGDVVSIDAVTENMSIDNMNIEYVPMLGNYVGAYKNSTEYVVTMFSYENNGGYALEGTSILPLVNVGANSSVQVVPVEYRPIRANKHGNVFLGWNEILIGSTVYPVIKSAF
jgi:hypothetical protein